MKPLLESAAKNLGVTVNINNDKIIKTVHGKYFYNSNGKIYGKNDRINGYKSYKQCVNQAFKLNSI